MPASPLLNNPLSNTHRDGILTFLKQWPEQMRNIALAEQAGIDLGERKQVMNGLKSAGEAILKAFFPETEIPS